MTDKRKYKYTIVFIILGIGVLVLLGCNIRIGSVSFSVQEVLQALLHKEVLDSATTIIWNIRFPRALAVLILGGALGLSGYLLQTFFHNPIAGPFVLGISSGAKMLVALCNDWIFKEGDYVVIFYYDCFCVFWLYDFHGICTCYVKKNTRNVYACY